jgi:hypothetical protein
MRREAPVAQNFKYGRLGLDHLKLLFERLEAAESKAGTTAGKRTVLCGTSHIPQYFCRRKALPVKESDATFIFVRHECGGASPEIISSQ